MYPERLRRYSEAPDEKDAQMEEVLLEMVGALGVDYTPKKMKVILGLVNAFETELGSMRHRS